MKQLLKKSTILLLFVFFVFISCEEEADSSNDCYTCDNCTAYPNILNGRQYCVEGFDNRSDWEQAKTGYETDSGCTCEFD